MELAIISILLVTVISLAGYLILNKKNNENDVSLIRGESVNEDRGSNNVMSLTNPYSKMTFDESLNSGIFMKRLQEGQIDEVNSTFAKMYGLSYSPESGVRFVESLKAYDNMSKIVWDLSKEAKKLHKSGKIKFLVHKKTGKLLGTTRNSSGKFVEQIKGVSPSKLAKVTNFTLIVVNTAHIISGADLARKMDKANRKLDELLAFRKIDRYSELEEIYYELIEINWKYLNKEEINKLTNLHQRIRQIRITTRNEFERELIKIKELKKNKSFKDKILGSDYNEDAIICEKVVNLRDKMKVLEYTFNIEIPITSVVGLDESAILTELTRFEKTIIELEAIGSEIKAKASGNSIDPDIQYLKSMKKKYELFSTNSHHNLDPTIEIQIAD